MSKQGHKSVIKLNKKEKIFVWVLLALAIIFMILETTSVHAELTDGLVAYFKFGGNNG